MGCSASVAIGLLTKSRGQQVRIGKSAKVDLAELVAGLL